MRGVTLGQSSTCETLEEAQARRNLYWVRSFGPAENAGPQDDTLRTAGWDSETRLSPAPEGRGMR
jgi:hypothetical protein